MESVLNQSEIHFQHPKVGTKTFEVIHRQFSGNWVNKVIQYDMEVALLNNLNPNQFVYEINRNKLLIDGSEPDAVFDQLACDCGNALFPLKFLVNRFGEIEQIYEHQLMVERWESIKERLVNYYEGEAALDYIKLMNTNIKNPEIVKSMMQNHLFVYFLFKPIYGFYEDNKVMTNWKAAPFMDFKKDIPMTQILVKEKNESDNKEIFNDEVQIEIQSDSDVIEINGKYTFDPKNNSIDSCEAILLMDGKKEIKLTFVTKQEKIVSN